MFHYFLDMEGRLTLRKISQSRVLDRISPHENEVIFLIQTSESTHVHSAKNVLSSLDAPGKYILSV